jgi:hypothetical protein
MPELAPVYIGWSRDQVNITRGMYSYTSHSYQWLKGYRIIALSQLANKTLTDRFALLKPCTTASKA